ncbi:MAG TPA: DUF4170 domain-containing protein [Stellaceae bacterium]|nr:DUF4170 domain-containing protein [Stellaceae bacterium]
MAYWVVGGEYTDTTFTTLAPGRREERIGPFASYDEAYAQWSARARATIDDATIWYRIIAEGKRAG